MRLNEQEINNYLQPFFGQHEDGFQQVTCHEKIQAIIDRIYGTKRPWEQPAARPKLSNIQKIRMIEETIEREIRPSLKHDGGDIDLVDVVGNRVLVATRGACATCQASQVTLKGFVEQKLKELVSPELVVEEVAP